MTAQITRLRVARERILKIIPKLAVLPAVLLSLSACQHAPTAPKVPPYNQLMMSAEANIRAQDVPSAMGEFRKAAELDRSAKEPWRRMAELDFNEKKYGLAIAQSQEVLKRDPADATAQSILTVSGLRVAIESIALIQRESDPKGPAHVEAQKVVQKLRDTLGQDALNAPKKKRRAVRPSASAGLESAHGAAVTRGIPDSSDPFSSLRASD